METEDKGKCARDISGQDFAANFDGRTEIEKTNLRPEESRSHYLFQFSFVDVILCSRISLLVYIFYVVLDFRIAVHFMVMYKTLTPTSWTSLRMSTIETAIYVFTLHIPCLFSSAKTEGVILNIYA